MTLEAYLALAAILAPLITWAIDKMGMRVAHWVFVLVIFISLSTLIIAGVLTAVISTHMGPRKVEGITAQADPSVTVTNSPGSIIAPGGGTNSITNNFGPPQRSISDDDALKIASSVRALGPHFYTVVDYTGGNDPDSSKYTYRIWGILKDAGWKPTDKVPGWFLPVGGIPLVGVHFLTHSDKVPPVAGALANILRANGVDVIFDYTKFPAIIHNDDTVGLAVGRAVQ